MGRKKAGHLPAAQGRLSHEATHDVLHIYAHELLMGGAPELEYPAVAEHLKRCKACRADLDELLEMTQLVYNPPDAPLGDYPELDLSRLPRPWNRRVNSDRPWFVDQFRRLWLEFSQPLLQGWQSSPLLGSARGALLFAYRQDATSTDPGLRVGIYAEDDPSLALVSVTVDLPDHEALDQSGVPVTIYVDESVRQTETDQSGTARFAQVRRDALPRLRLAITLDRSA